MHSNRRGTWCAAALGLVLTSLCLFSSAPTAAQTDTDINSKRVTLNLDNADIRSALKLLFQSVGANFSIDPTIQGTVTVQLNDVPFRTALENVLRSSGMPLTYRSENNVYSIQPKQDTGPDLQGPPVGTDTATTEPVKPKGSWRKIHLMYADSFDLASLFGGQIIQSRLSQMSNGGGNGGYGGGFGGGGFGGGFGNNGGFGGGFGNNGGFGGGFGGGGFGGGFGGGGFGNNSFGGGFGNNSFGGGGFGNNNFGGGRRY